jgi:hypothetical protein
MTYDPASNPFPGLRPFESNEGYLFFGREGQSEELLNRLLLVRLLAVVGTSGSGKSSLVRAGLVPYLRALPGSHWRVATLRPSGDPIGSLVNELDQPDVIGKAEQDTDNAARDRSLLEARLRRSSLGLIEVVRLARLPEGQNLLIVVDQFEELFRLIDSPDHRGDSAAFVGLILEAARQTEQPIYVVLTMRSDFIGDCAQFPGLPETVAAGLYLIPRMTRDQRRAAIEEPIRIAGGAISRPLTNRVLNDAGDDPDQLPIMQHALRRTWEDWQKSGPPPDKPMDLDNYRAVGGMANALSNHANEAFGELEDDDKDIARRMFQCLTEKETDNRKVRRATDVATLAKVVGVTVERIKAVIETFRKDGRSFLMPATALNDDSRIDISHESLIRRWDRLAQWVEEEADSATIYRRLQQTAVLHEQRRAGLWGDPDLAESLTWKEQTKPTGAWAERYGGRFQIATDFLEESRKARDAALLRQRRFWQSVVAATVLVIIGLSAVTTWALIANVSAQRATKAANQATAAANQATVDVSQVATLSRQQLSDRDADYLDRVGDVLTWAPPTWSAYLHRDKAQVLESSKDFASARTEIDLAKKADPDYLPALVSSSDLYVIAGDADGAVRDSEEYLQVTQTNTIAYGNLILAQATLRNYGEAIGKIDEALQNARLTISDVESLVAPDIQELTHGFKLSVPDSDFLLALRYTKALLYAMSGDQRFEAALREADQSDRDYPYSRNAYLTALNWQWLIVRGQGFLDVRAAAGAQASAPRELADYGVYAAEGALWARVAQTRPEYADRAQKAYAKFRAAYRADAQDRYQALATWTDRQAGKPVEPAPPELTVECAAAGTRLPAVDCARALAEQAQELKVPAGSHPLNFASAFIRLSAAIDLLAAKPGSSLGRRQQDLLIDLLLRRAGWRIEGGADEQDKGGAADDAHAVLALDPNVPDAYRLLAASAFDDATRKANYEKALALAPYNSAALSGLAKLIQGDAPKDALALLQKRQRVSATWSDDYLLLSQLQTQIGNYDEALRDVESAIETAPWRLELYAQRRKIEQKIGNVDSAKLDLHFAQGMRVSGAYEAQTGSDGLALKRYLLAFMTASGLQTPDDDANFEVAAIIRDMSRFLTDHYSVADARQFWQSLSQDPLLSPSQQQLAAKEVTRLTP